MKIIVVLLVISAFVNSSFGIGPRTPGTQNLKKNMQVRTPVSINTVVQKGETIRLDASIKGATQRSQLVVFLNYEDQSGLRIAKNLSGEAAMPRTRNKIFNSFPDNQTISEWTVEFYQDKNAGKILEIYAIACEVVANEPGWPNSRDYQSFRFLPFDKAESIDDALSILKDFGWLPSGLTKFVR